MTDIIDDLIRNKNKEYLECPNCPSFFDKWGGTHERLLQCTYCAFTITVRHFFKKRAPTHNDLNKMIYASKKKKVKNYF